MDKIVIILFITFISTVLSAMSGGGASVISLPVFLSLGLSYPVAASILKICQLFWILPASYNYLKDRKIDWVFLILFSLIGLIGAYFGVLIAIYINQFILKRFIGVVIVSLVIYTYFNKSLGLKEKGKNFNPIRKMIAYPIAIILGFYEGIFGGGNGILFTITTYYTRGFDLIDGLGYYYAVAFFWIFLAVFILLQKGYNNIQLTIPAIIGSVIGGYIGSKYAKYKGNKYIKVVFIIFGGVLGIKLILGL